MTQDQAFAILKSGVSVFLTGEPGSGKTHTVNRYVAYLRSHGIEPALTASTGIAATHISGMTVHSWAGIGILERLMPYDLDRIAANERVYKRLSKAHVLIIDEISMLDARTLDMVDAVCKAVRRNPLPFGGLQTVLVGDFFQLPPVAREGRAAAFSFHASAWSELRPTVCYLTEQHRQDDRGFLSVLSAIRSNTVEETHLRVLEADNAAAPDPGTVRLFPHNADVDRINAQELTRLGGKERAFTVEAKGPDHLLASLKRGCLSPERLLLKENAAVMFTRNDPQSNFVNGTLGTVTGFDPDSGFPVVKKRGGGSLTAEPMEWRIEDQGKPLATLRQVPLRLAWAITVHKSQGMSLDAAVIDLGSAFEFGQGYVALSRVRRLDGLHLLRCNRRALEVHPEILEEDDRFRQASSAAERNVSLLAPGTQDVHEKSFIFACRGKMPTPKTFSVADVRQTHAKAYARWSAEEEKELAALFRGGADVKTIAARLRRKTGGISSRLKKMGLIDAERAS